MIVLKLEMKKQMVPVQDNIPTQYSVSPGNLVLGNSKGRKLKSELIIQIQLPITEARAVRQ